LIPAVGLVGRAMLGNPGMRFVRVGYSSSSHAETVGHALIPRLVRAWFLN
jgi:hypothetical protein